MQQLTIVLKNYSKLKPINCTVISGDIKKLFTVKIDENVSKKAEFIKGDPVLIGLASSNEKIKIWGGSVIATMPTENSYIICSKEFEEYPQELENREIERYDTSLLANIKLINTSKREAACIKNISFTGMCILSTGEYEVNDIVDIELYFSSNVLIYEAEILTKLKHFNRNEYGVQLKHRDKNAMYTAKGIIDSIIQNDKDLMLRHSSSLVLKA